MNKRIAVVGFLLGAAIGAGPGIASSIKNWTTRETIKATDLNAALNHIHTVAEAGVDSSRIEDGAVAEADLADGAVTSAKILDGTIAAGDIATGAVATDEILDGTIVDVDVGAGGINLGKINNTWSGTSAAHDFASIASAACATTTVTVSGAAVGDPVVCGFSVAPAGGLVRNFDVTAGDTVTVQLCNTTAGAIDPAATDIDCRYFLNN